MDFRQLSTQRCIWRNNKLSYGGAGKVQFQTPRMLVDTADEGETLRILNTNHPEFESFLSDIAESASRPMELYSGWGRDRFTPGDECEWFGPLMSGEPAMYEVAMLWTVQGLWTTKDDRWGLRIQTQQLKVYKKQKKRPLFVSDDTTDTE